MTQIYKSNQMPQTPQNAKKKKKKELKGKHAT